MMRLGIRDLLRTQTERFRKYSGHDVPAPKLVRVFFIEFWSILTLPPETSPSRMLVNSAWTHSGKGKNHGQETARR